MLIFWRMIAMSLTLLLISLLRAKPRWTVQSRSLAIDTYTFLRDGKKKKLQKLTSIINEAIKQWTVTM